MDAEPPQRAAVLATMVEELVAARTRAMLTRDDAIRGRERARERRADAVAAAGRARRLRQAVQIRLVGKSMHPE
jgi:hypothetical protein